MDESEAIQLRAKYESQISECLTLLESIFKDDLDKASKWMESDNPFLGNVSPMWLIVRNRGHKVLQFIKSTIDENKHET